MPVVRQTEEEASGTATYLDWPRKICSAKADNNFVSPRIAGGHSFHLREVGKKEAVLNSPRLFLNFRQTDGERTERVINFRPLALPRWQSWRIG